MDEWEQLEVDAKLHVDAANQQIVEWQIKLAERQRHLRTIEIIKSKKEKQND